MRWAEHVARIGEKRISVGKLEGKKPLGRPRLSERRTLKWILEKWDGVVWTGLIWLRIGTSGGFLRTR
jgi:hypothetical protein